MSLQMIFSGSEIAQSKGPKDRMLILIRILSLSSSYSSERGIFAFLLATGIGKVSVVIGAGNLSCPAC